MMTLIKLVNGQKLGWLNLMPTTARYITVTLKRNLANTELPLSFNNTILETVAKHKHLGVKSSTNLSWKDHVTTISESAGKKLNILAKLKNLLDRKSFINNVYLFHLARSGEC